MAATQLLKSGIGNVWLCQGNCGHYSKFKIYSSLISKLIILYVFKWYKYLNSPLKKRFLNPELNNHRLPSRVPISRKLVQKGGGLNPEIQIWDVGVSGGILTAMAKHPFQNHCQVSSFYFIAEFNLGKLNYFHDQITRIFFSLFWTFYKGWQK